MPRPPTHTNSTAMPTHARSHTPHIATRHPGDGDTQTGNCSGGQRRLDQQYIRRPQQTMQRRSLATSERTGHAQFGHASSLLSNEVPNRHLFSRFGFRRFPCFLLSYLLLGFLFFSLYVSRLSFLSLGRRRAWGGPFSVRKAAGVFGPKYRATRAPHGPRSF